MESQGFENIAACRACLTKFQGASRTAVRANAGIIEIESLSVCQFASDYGNMYFSEKNVGPLFSLQARVVAGDTLGKHVIAISGFQHVQRLLLSRILKESAQEVLAIVGRIETPHDMPLAQRFLVCDALRQHR